MKTPDWILEGFDSEAGYEKVKGIKNKKVKEGKTFKVRRCPKCESDNISVVLGFDEGKGKGEWECKKCGWVGRNVKEDEMNEEQFMKYLDGKEK